MSKLSLKPKEGGVKEANQPVPPSSQNISKPVVAIPSVTHKTPTPTAHSVPLNLANQTSISVPVQMAPAVQTPTAQQYQIACAAFADYYKLMGQLQHMNTNPNQNHPAIAMARNHIQTRINQLAGQLSLYQLHYDPNFVKNQHEIYEKTRQQIRQQQFVKQQTAQQQGEVIDLTRVQSSRTMAAPQVELSESENALISSLYQQIQKSKEESGQSSSYVQPKELRINLLPYQLEGLSWLKGNEKEASLTRGGLLCDDMGLGKTVSEHV